MRGLSSWLTNNRQLVLWFTVMCGIAGLSFPLLALRGQIIIIAAFLGAWPALAVATFTMVVNRPHLKIILDPQDLSTHKPSLTMIDISGQPVWRFLRITVRNNGFSVAQNCSGELKVLKRPQRRGKDCDAPSRERRKRLHWSDGIPRQLRNIPSRGGEGELDILLDDSSFPTSSRLRVKVGGRLAAWVATDEIFSLGAPALRNQDGLCTGQYIVEVNVFPENGPPASKQFKLNVDTNWTKVTLEELR